MWQINNLKAKNMRCHSLNFLSLFPFFSFFSRQHSHGLSIRGLQFKTCWKFFVAVWLRVTVRDTPKKLWQLGLMWWWVLWLERWCRRGYLGPAVAHETEVLWWACGGAKLDKLGRLVRRQRLGFLNVGLVSLDLWIWVEWICIMGGWWVDSAFYFYRWWF